MYEFLWTGSAWTVEAEQSHDIILIHRGGILLRNVVLFWLKTAGG